MVSSKMNPSFDKNSQSVNGRCCHICGHHALEVFSLGSEYVRITSDCKPWPVRSELALCPKCQSVQSVVTSEWRRQISEIYRQYQVYHQGGGAEQVVFNSTGDGHTRSSRIVARLEAHADLPARGHALDIGCGNGSFLAAFKNIFPEWLISGAEFDDKHADDLASLPDFQRLHTCGVDRIEGRFDFVSLIHTLEHIENPLSFLAAARSLLSPCGLIFIQVPHYRENPFELMTYDHATHFDVSTLTSLLRLAELQPISVSTDWVSKEISVVASASVSRGIMPPSSGEEVHSCLEWLENLINHARKIQSKSESFGLFGSSIAATWTAANLPHLPDFFVDEDVARIGRKHLDCDILHPDHIPSDSVVFVALQPGIQNRILARYRANSNCSWLGC